MNTPTYYTVADGYAYAYTDGEFLLTVVNDDGSIDWDDADKLDRDDLIDGPFVHDMIDAMRAEGKIWYNYWQKIFTAQGQINEVLQ